MTTHNQLCKWLHGPLDKHYRGRLFRRRIENTASSGLPDEFFCLDGISFWIEYKIIPPKKRETTLLTTKFRPRQIPTILELKEAGAAVYILAQLEKERFLFNGGLAPALERGIMRKYIAASSLLDSSEFTQINVIDTCKKLSKTT